MSKVQVDRLGPRARRDAILSAAATIFFERGYADTSIDAIIERVGGSKRDIYAQFGSKQGLFTAIMSEVADQALGDQAIDERDADDLESALTVFGLRLMEAYMTPTLLGVYRTIVAEAHRHPALAAAFYDRGPGRAVVRVSELLRRLGGPAAFGDADPAVLAEHFVGLVRGNLHLQVVLGLRPPPTVDEARRAVASAVGVFLHGLRGPEA